ncbi:hypothetical protein AB2L27_13475 [Kineococcus sp. LSe6-4]|uniref:DUF2267 domain-containing protein n=1 Tax=Kineococcus halophytocola TaxID=3234027 RepID=A0ABV4H2G6_9ACTN
MSDPRNENRRQGESLDAVLRGLLKQGRLDPTAERLAEQGIDRLRSFLGSGPAPGTAATPEAEQVQDAEVVTTGREMLMHTIPLPDGTRVEVLVPERLTRAEAERIATVLGALAVDE